MRTSLHWIKSGSVLMLIALASAVRSGDAAAQAPKPVTTASQSISADSPPQNLWLILVDDLHIDFRSSGHLRTLLKTICSELIQDGEVAGMVSTGPSSIAVDLTSDPKRVGSGILRATGSSLRPTDIRAAQADRTGPNEGSTEVWYRAAVSISTAYDTVEHSARQPARRKAVIYVSSGYGVGPDTGPQPDGDRHQTRCHVAARQHQRIGRSRVLWPSSLARRDARTLRSLRLIREGSPFLRPWSQASTAPGGRTTGRRRGTVSARCPREPAGLRCWKRRTSRTA